ncbi:MAG: hypothetical protein HQK99_17195 [Nitrospirae bacterium]|nr:hypothetical protein [Nitrospirota bacterium]
MIKPNWDIFKAKFSENHQTNFEWFCYLLFCQEFNKPQGIFRYKNQSAIETNPVQKDGHTVGWQAKYYDATLSTNKNNLISTLERAKRVYPTISRIILYTNQEWAQANGQPPKAMKEVEATAKKPAIDLEWRTASFFESPFVSRDNEKIAKHFFSQDKSIFDLVQEKQRHTEVVLSVIKTNMKFDGTKIEIDRSELLRKLREGLNQNQIIVISGVGGVGKTAVIKNLY